MSEISETEIKAMTKEECYMRGYKDGKKDAKQRTGYISIDDVMSVFDDFMCGEVDEDGTDTFLEMLKDKSESEEV